MTPAAEEEPGFLAHPLVRLVVVSLTLAGLLRLLFFRFAERIWAMRADIPLSDITPWSRWAMAERDGAEPQALLLLVMVLIAATVLALKLLERAPAWVRETVTAACLIGSALFAFAVPAEPPVQDIDRVWWHVAVTLAVMLPVAFLMYRAALSRAIVAVLAVCVAPVCFLAVSLPSRSDLTCILAPALKFRLGFPPSQVYMQYDFLMPLLAVAWHRVGGAAMTFTRVTQTAYFLLLLGCFLVARRLFQQPRLAALLLVALCAVRIFGLQHDANALPQVTPLRIDLWILLLAPALFFGLRHWSVGLAVGLICFFARSFGILYLGSYALALLAAFLVQREDSRDRVPFWRDAAAYAVGLWPAIALIGAALLAGRLVFGAAVSDAALMYHRLGLGMLRIEPHSFYWWLAPMLGGTAWLTFSLRQTLGAKQTGAAIFLLALAVGNSIYFFGRSHEHNLLNVSAPLLFCAFLAADLAIAAWRGGPRLVRWSVYAAPWVLLALIAFFYSGRLAARVDSEYEFVALHRPLPPVDYISPVVCSEISSVARDSRVFVYSPSDYWIYEQCGYAPPGYLQPLLLQALTVDLTKELNRLLDADYKIVEPKANAQGFELSAIAPGLREMERTETPHYFIYRRKQ